MSDYTTIAELELRTKIFAPVALRAFRSGDLTLPTNMYSYGSPLTELYKQQYKYITTPEYPSPEALQLLGLPQPAPEVKDKYQASRQAILQLLQTGADPAVVMQARTYPPRYLPLSEETQNKVQR